MKKIFLFLLCSFCLAACTPAPAYVFAINNEQVAVILNENMTLTEEENGFEIQDDDIIIHGMFIESETFDEYYQTVLEDDEAVILKKDKNKLIWKINGESGLEQDCLFRISNEIAVLMGSLNEDETIYTNIDFEIETKE